MNLLRTAFTEEQVLGIVLAAILGALVLTTSVEWLWTRYRARLAADHQRVETFLRSSWL